MSLNKMSLKTIMLLNNNDVIEHNDIVIDKDNNEQHNENYTTIQDSENNENNFNTENLESKEHNEILDIQQHKENSLDKTTQNQDILKSEKSLQEIEINTTNISNQ